MSTPIQVTPSRATPPTPSASAAAPNAEAPRAAARGETFAEGERKVAPPRDYDIGTKRDKGAPATPADATQGTRWGYKKDDSGRIVPDDTKSERGYMRALNPGGGIAWNKGRGNRDGDLPSEKDPTKAANESIDLKTITGVPEPELDKIKSSHKREVKGAAGTYAGYDVAAGEASASSTDFDGKSKRASGKDGTEVTGPNAYYQAGATAKGYVGIKGEAEGAVGKASGKAEAYGKAYAGLSGKASLGASAKDKSELKASVEGAIGAGVEVGVTGKADVKSPGLKVDGVTTPLDVGVGVGGSAKAYAKAGAGGGAYLTRGGDKTKIGLEGKIGAAAAAEAKADIHGNIGPVAAKGEIGALAGAGIGAEGGIIYEDGKLTIGGRAYAALGYGVSSGVSVTIDLKQSYQMGRALLKKASALGIQGAKEAYKAADADRDGKLSANDGATHAANAMNAGAAGVEHGVDAAISALDGDGDGKFDAKKDLGARATQAKDALVGAGRRAVHAGKDVVDEARKGGAKAVDWAARKVDEGTQWAAQKKDEALSWGGQKLDEAKQLVERARALDGDQVSEAIGRAADETKEWASAKVDAAQEWGKAKGAAAVDGVKGLARGAAKKVHTLADRDHDGKVDGKDRDKAIAEVGHAVHTTATAIKQKLHQTYEGAKKSIVDGHRTITDLPDLNGDHKVDAQDWARAKQATREAAERAAALAKQRTAEALKAAQDGATKLAAKAKATVGAARKAADLDGSGSLGLDDAKVACEMARAGLSRAGDTLSDGFTRASQRAGAALDRFSRFWHGSER